MRTDDDARHGPSEALPGQMALPLASPPRPAPPPPPPPARDGRPPSLSTSLGDAKEWLQERLDEGVACPCCDQFAKIYKRPMTGTMAYALILIHRHFQSAVHTEWLHVPTYLSAAAVGVPAVARGGDWAKLVHWGMILDKGDVRDDGSNRAGYYKITERGRAFVQGTISVPKYIWIYNGTALGAPDEPEALVSIRDVLGTKFDYAELMSPAGMSG